MMRLVVTAWLATLSSVAAAQEARNLSSFDLRVQPLLCIIDRRTPACDMTFLVNWESGRSGDFCLFNDHADGPLLCWQEQSSGNYSDARAVRDEFRYWMTPEGSSRELAAVTVEVLRLDSDDRRRRRRSRHVWDVL